MVAWAHNFRPARGVRWTCSRGWSDEVERDVFLPQKAERECQRCEQVLAGLALLKECGAIRADQRPLAVLAMYTST